MNTDRIEKKILLHAPRSRVWRAITDSKEFGIWFGVKFESPFVPGANMQGVMVTTSVNPEIAKLQKKYEGKPFNLVIESIEPERLFSFRWHPHAVDAGVDYSSEPMTLVEFTLKEVGEGIELTVTESGFDQIPLARRASAFSANDGGWALVITLVEAYLALEH